MYDFGKEMNFDEKPSGNKSDGDGSNIRIPYSPAIMVSLISTICLSERS